MALAICSANMQWDSGGPPCAIYQSQIRSRSGVGDHTGVYPVLLALLVLSYAYCSVCSLPVLSWLFLATSGIPK